MIFNALTHLEKCNVWRGREMRRLNGNGFDLSYVDTPNMISNLFLILSLGTLGAVLIKAFAPAAPRPVRVAVRVDRTFRRRL